MEHELAQAGDRLKQVIERAVGALMAGNQEALWQALDHDSFLAMREWDKLRGREVPSLSRVEESRLDLIRSLSSSIGPRSPGLDDANWHSA